LEPPLTHSGNRALVQSSTEAPNHADVSDASVAVDDDLEVDVAFNCPPPRFVRVGRPHLTKHNRRLDSRASAEGSAARAAAASLAETVTLALAHPGSGARANATLIP
jgi:hypothetical protein